MSWVQIPPRAALWKKIAVLGVVDLFVVPLPFYLLVFTCTIQLPFFQSLDNTSTLDADTRELAGDTCTRNSQTEELGQKQGHFVARRKRRFLQFWATSPCTHSASNYTWNLKNSGILIFPCTCLFLNIRHATIIFPLLL